MIEEMEWSSERISEEIRHEKSSFLICSTMSIVMSLSMLLTCVLEEKQAFGLLHVATWLGLAAIRTLFRMQKLRSIRESAMVREVMLS